MSYRGGSLLETLAAIDVHPDEIEITAFTHLHVDHSGWAFVHAASDPRGRRPTFPNAEYIVAEGEMALLENSSAHAYTRDARSLRRSLHEHCQLSLIHDGDEIAPGITALVTPGHSPGHTSYILTSNRGRRVVAFGDAFHTPAQIGNTAWHSDPDTKPKAVPTARARVLLELLTADTLGFAFHFGDQPFGRVSVNTGGELSWQAVPTTVLLPPPRPLRRRRRTRRSRG